MGLIISLLIGALVGWLASMLMKTDAQMGAIGNILVGIVGAALGRFLAALLGLAAISMLGSMLISCRCLRAHRDPEDGRSAQVN